MPRMTVLLSSLAAATLIAAVALFAAAPAQAEDSKITRCPAGKSYCVQETKPLLSAAEAARLDAIQSGKLVPVRTAKADTPPAPANYREPKGTPLCPPPHRMTARDGCQ